MHNFAESAAGTKSAGVLECISRKWDYNMS